MKETFFSRLNEKKYKGNKDNVATSINFTIKLCLMMKNCFALRMSFKTTNAMIALICIQNFSINAKCELKNLKKNITNNKDLFVVHKKL